MTIITDSAYFFSLWRSCWNHFKNKNFFIYYSLPREIRSLMSNVVKFKDNYIYYINSVPRGLRCKSAAARLLRSWIRIPPGAWMFVCCVLSGRGLCDELITLSEESYRLWCVVVCDLETSRMRRTWPALGRSATKKNINSVNINP